MNILILSTQYNRYGGAATCAYETQRYFLKNNINSICLFFENSVLNDKNKYNNDNLDNVYACKLLKDYLVSDVKLNIYKDIKQIITNNFGNNFIMLGFNYLAPLIGKLLFPNNKMYYMITGTCYISNVNTVYANELINNEFTQSYNEIEKKTIEISDYVIPNSNITKNIIKNIYKINPNEIFDLHEIYREDIDTNLILTDGLINYDYIKTYDLIFITSNFSRKVKNVDFIKKIFESDRLQDFKKIVIGKNSKDYFDTTIKNLEICDFLNQEQTLNVIRKSKILLIPSFVESYSITCIEATNNNCIPIVSSNVGCNNFINDFYIVQSYNLNDWIYKINVILNNYIYHTKIFYNNFENQNKILDIEKITSSVQKKKVLFVTVDVPGIGGAATNTLNLINNFKDKWEIYCIFIDNDVEKQISGIDNYVIIKNDNDIFDKLINYKNVVEQDKKFDFIFCKNYKSLIYIKNVFKNSNVIFSPSGIRYVGKLVETNYLNNINITEYNANIAYMGIDNKYKFVNINDHILDFLALNYSDIIIPNSKLTYNVINQIYKNEKQINYPIYTTNINYSETNLNSNFKTREYDIMFCSYSWARKCKNMNLVEKLINILPNYKILLVGKKITNPKLNNVTYIEHINNNEIHNYLLNVKTVVIPSFYDSNPNILIEAVYAGCNVVTSRNVGNSEYLNNKLIVNNPINIDEWIEKINTSSQQHYKYTGPNGLSIKNNIIKITNGVKRKIMTVGIYKINPLWDTEEKFKFVFFTFNIKKNDNFVSNIVNNDIYFMLTYKIGLTNNSNDINYIIIDETILINECYYVYNTFSYYENFVKIWKIKSRDELLFFNEAEIYFLRGNYHKFYNLFILNNNSKVIFYPATSFKQDITLNNVSTLNNKYNVVLIHENPIYNKIYQNNKCLLFKKFTSDNFVNYNLERIYDICFVATENQLTKNHNLFLAFVDYLETNCYNINIIFIGDLQKILNNKNLDYMSKFKYVKFEYKCDLSKNELIEIYNLSKNNLIFSGRDAFPRVVCESSACGCFNIALDTLDDGICLYDGILGVLIGEKEVSKKILKGSLSYLPDARLFDKIISEIKIKREHNEISIRYKDEYNINNLVKNINDLL